MKVSMREVPSEDGRQTFKFFGITCVVPKGMTVVEMNPLTPKILGYYTPAYTWREKIRVNPRWFPTMDAELLIEECIHGFQYRRMGAEDFFPTYLWHGFINLFRKRRKHVSLHNANMMEREAMNGAAEIMKRVRGKDYIDIEKEIIEYFGWQKYAKR